MSHLIVLIFTGITIKDYGRKYCQTDNLDLNLKDGGRRRAKLHLVDKLIEHSPKGPVNLLPTYNIEEKGIFFLPKHDSVNPDK